MVFATTLELKIETNLPAGKNLGYMGMTFSLMCYNEEVVASWPFPAGRFNYATFSGSASAAVYSDSTNITKSYNTFWGLTSFGFSGQSFFQFSSSFVPEVSLSLTSSNPFSNIDGAMTAMEFKECDSTTPYYMISEAQCYDICPGRYYEDNVQFICSVCTAYDCWKCVSNGTCTSCNGTADFRTLNAATGRCAASDGYYDDGTNSSVAKPCNSNCKTCSGTDTFCQSCYSGFYLNSNACSPCPGNCSICSSGTACSNCSTYFKLDVSNACVPSINCSAIS